MKPAAGAVGMLGLGIMGSAMSANLVKDEVDCIAQFEEKLDDRGLLSKREAAAVRERSP